MSRAANPTHRSGNVILVDDDELVAASIALALRGKGHSVTVFPSAEAFLADVKSEPVGCLVVDVNLPGMSGIDLLHRIRNSNWTMPVVVLSGAITVDEALEAVRESVVAIVQKPVSRGELVNAVELALANLGKRPRLAASALRQTMDNLAEAERSVLAMLVDGAPNKTIALRLDLGLRSVVRYRKSVLDAFGVESVPELASLLAASGIETAGMLRTAKHPLPLPMKQRQQLRDRLCQLAKNMSVTRDLAAQKDEFQMLREIEAMAEELLEIIDHPSLLAPDQMKGSPSEVLVVTDNVREGKLICNLLQVHGLYAEVATGVVEASELLTLWGDPLPLFLVGVESRDITHEGLGKLAELLPANRGAHLFWSGSPIESTGNGDKTAPSITVLPHPLDGILLVNLILDQLAGVRY
jgi:two-component system, LuxR family, response regulator FixJ